MTIRIEFNPATEHAFVFNDGSFQIGSGPVPSDAILDVMEKRGGVLFSPDSFVEFLQERADREDAEAAERAILRAAAVEKKRQLNDSAYAKHVAVFGENAFTPEEWATSNGGELPRVDQTPTPRFPPPEQPTIPFEPASKDDDD